METFTWIALIAAALLVGYIVLDWYRAGRVKRALAGGQGFDRGTLIDAAEVSAATEARAENARALGRHVHPNPGPGGFGGGLGGS